MPRALSYDRALCFTVIALLSFGLMMVFSVTTAGAAGGPLMMIKQLVAATIGLVAMRRLMFRDYHDWRNHRVAFGAVGLAIVLLIVAAVFGSGANTARFLRVGVLSLQPSELAKPALILFLAYYLESRKAPLDDWRSLGGAGLVIAALCSLILLGRDLGGAVGLLLIAGAVFFTAGIRWRYIWAGTGALVAVFILGVLIDPYRMKRLLIFLDPEADPQGAGFQIIQSKIAVGSGGWLGQGFMLGRQKMRFLPEAHTDFIFAVIGEELGLIGCLIVILGFLVILWRGVRTAMRAPDSFGAYIAAGVTAMIVCQAMINIGVVLALLPTKGMTLPFISYGGTSLITFLAAAGLLLNVSQYAE